MDQPLDISDVCRRTGLTRRAKAVRAVHAGGDSRDDAGATKLYERMGEWEGEVNAPFSSEVFAFIQEVGRQRGV